MSLNQYYTLGNSGLRVSRLALGTMTFGAEWGWGAEKDGARELFNAYVDAGGNFIDTADLYTNGTSETWLGAFIKKRKLREQIVIATKFSYNGQPSNPNAGGNGRKHIRHAVEGSLKRLGTDYIDLYLLHTWDRITPPEEVMSTLNDLVREGKILHAGLSDVPAWYAAKAQTIARLKGYEPVSALQLEYSLVERNIENEYIDLGQNSNMGIMVWSPLATGLLSGKYKPTADGISGTGRLATVKDSGNPAFEKFTDRNWSVVAALEKVAAELGESMARVAINWVANRPGVASVLLGATKLSQLEQSLTALDFQIPEKLLNQLDEASVLQPQFPYTFFTPGMQAMLTGGTTVGSKPDGYHKEVLINAQPVGVE